VLRIYSYDVDWILKIIRLELTRQDRSRTAAVETRTRVDYTTPRDALPLSVY